MIEIGAYVKYMPQMYRFLASYNDESVKHKFYLGKVIDKDDLGVKIRWVWQGDGASKGRRSTTQMTWKDFYDKPSVEEITKTEYILCCRYSVEDLWVIKK